MADVKKMAKEQKVALRKQWASAVIPKLLDKYGIDHTRGWQTALAKELGVAQQVVDGAMRGLASVEWLALLAAREGVPVAQDVIGGAPLVKA